MDSSSRTDEPRRPDIERESGDAGLREIERQEHIHDVHRLRKAAILGLLVYPAFGAADWLVVTYMDGGSLAYFLTVRFAFYVPVMGAAIRLWSDPIPSPRLFLLLELIMFGGAATMVAILSLEHGGIASPYTTGIFICMLVRGCVLASPWKRALVSIAIPTAMYPIVVGVAAAFDPEIRAQFHDSRALAGLVENLCFLASEVALLVWGSHTMWTIRRELFETRSIGRYRLKQRIGEGGMGEVWTAYHKALDRDVAIKILHPERVSRVDVARFEREAAALASLTHPHTVRIYDHGVTDDGIWFYAMELLDGETVADLVRREGPLPPARAVSLATQAARALAEAHARGIVHRDIKPENLFVARLGGESDFIKVLDFGIAKLVQSGQHTTLTQANWVGGTPAYMSPEAARGERVDARSDVYGLGAVLYYMLTGAPPFEAPTIAALLSAQISERPRPPSERRGVSIDGVLENLVMRCLEKAPDARPQSTARLAELLSQSSDADAYTPGVSDTAAPQEQPSEVPFATTVGDPKRGSTAAGWNLPTATLAAPTTGDDRHTPRPQSGTELDDGAPSSQSPDAIPERVDFGSVERQEHVHDVQRLRKAAQLGVIIHPAFGFVDWLVVTYIHPGSLSYYLAVRFAFYLIVVGCCIRLWREPIPSRGLFTALEWLIFVSACTMVAILSLEHGGIASPYAQGIIVVILVRGCVLASQWRRALVSIGVAAAAYPVVIGIAALVDPVIRSQFGNARDVAGLIENLCFLTSTVALMVWGSHTIWAIRRQLFEARSIGRYRLKERIGTGGMGEVWAAYHKALNRDVAVKILHPARVTSVDVARFEREAEALATLAHPNTVRVFDHGVTDDGIWYYAMELLDGETVAELVRREGPLPPERAVYLTTQAARALAEAHSRGIVHRDVKPENLFVARLGGETDFVKVLDFGIAKLQAGKHTTLTQANWVGGTPAYMSPEAARGAPVDARSDVYGLGAVLYFMLVGAPPFEAPTIAALLAAQLGQRPTAPSARCERPISDELEALVMRCLEKDPDARPQTAAALADVLADTPEAGAWAPSVREPADG